MGYDRDTNVERSPVAGLALHPQFPAVLTGDAIAYAEPQTGDITHFFGGIKRLQNHVEVL